MSGHANGFSQFNLTFYFLLAILSLKMARKHKLRNNRRQDMEFRVKWRRLARGLSPQLAK